MISGDQVRMARAALKWGVRDLAKRAAVTAATVTRIEAGRPGHAATIQAIQAAFERAGIEFIQENGAGAGVRFAKPKADEQ
ncbi:helix-turn-helix transcriptional regulator [Rhizobium sp. BK376]|uniref:helix-turn-helix domain-containing protein n=1 Tax=Rhizobium sp. BK376 TaxID=2512149 RepID=UPI0024786CC3|nr:helix-turn-helix transcriptional regulator [Rhizobium sp. BK376]